jgi:NADH-quinone oxidoreductase subunit C
VNTLETASQIQARFGDLIAGPVEFRGEITLLVGDCGRIAEVCAFARKDLGFDLLLDVTSVDHYGDDPRYTVVYELYSIAGKCRLRLKTPVSEARAQLPSVSGVWRAADWMEREVYDMMGIQFTGHPDLRRILMWEGYPYHPLRKDFPLAGKPTDLPGIAFTKPAPLEGGPFVTTPGSSKASHREPRARTEEAAS